MSRYVAHYIALLKYVVALPLWLALDWYLWTSMPFQTTAKRLWFALLPAVGFAFHPMAWWQPLPADWANESDAEGPAI